MKPLVSEFVTDKEYFKGTYIASYLNDSEKKFFIFNQGEKPKGFKYLSDQN